MNSSISVAIVITLLIAGLIVGLSVAGIDLLNPWTSIAQSQRISSGTNHQDQMYKLEEQQKQAEYQAYLQQQKILEEQQTRQAAIDLDYQQQLNDIKLQREAAWTETGGIALIMVTTAMTAGLVGIIWIVASRLVHTTSVSSSIPVAPISDPAKQPDLWDDPEYRAFAIYLARQTERGQYGVKPVQPLVPKPVSMSLAPTRYVKGDRRYKDLPLAGD